VLALVLLGVAILAACGPPPITGTSIPATQENLRALTDVEDYRIALERDDYDRLAKLTAPTYRECRSTPDAREECVTADNLRSVLAARFAGTNLRYAMRYDRTTRIGKLVRVDVLVDMEYARDGVAYYVRAPHALMLDMTIRRFTSGMLPPPASESRPIPGP
jgi:hypothetical protein